MAATVICYLEQIGKDSVCYLYHQALAEPTHSQLLSGKVKVKLSLCLTNEALRHEGVLRSGCIDPHCLDLGPCRFTPGERTPGTHWIGGWVDSRTSLDDVENRRFLTLPGLELRPLGRPGRS
jgi:hypothetical protein